MKNAPTGDDLEHNENTDEGKKNEAERCRGRGGWWISIEDQTNLLLPFLKHMACDARVEQRSISFSNCQLNPYTNPQPSTFYMNNHNLLSIYIWYATRFAIWPDQWLRLEIVLPNILLFIARLHFCKLNTSEIPLTQLVSEYCHAYVFITRLF